MIKAFFHGRGPHSHGFDGYVLCGVVPDDKTIFDEKTCDQYPCQNYTIALGTTPTESELQDIIDEKILAHQDFIDNPPQPPAEEKSAPIKRLARELGISESVLPNTSDELLDMQPEEYKVDYMNFNKQKIAEGKVFIPGVTDGGL